RRNDEILIDIVLAERHVGAVLAVEDQRKLRVVTDAADHQRGQPFRIDLHSLRRHTLAGELLEDEASHMLIADAADQSRLQAQSRATAGNIGWRTADILLERAHILQSAADLGAVEVHAGAADSDDVKCLGHAVTSQSGWSCRSRPPSHE